MRRRRGLQTTLLHTLLVICPCYCPTEHDVLMWDHIGTLHNAIPDYRPAEPRRMMRCQVMADRIFDPAFVRASLGALAPN